MKRVGEELLLDYKQMKNLMKYRDKYSDYALVRKLLNFLIDSKRKKFVYRYSCDISPICTLGKIDFRHPVGIIIGAGVIIEDEVTVLQNVTIGAYHLDGKIPETHIKKGTLIGAGAAILGSVCIGKNCIIGANSVVTKDVPDNSIVVGVNRIVPRKANDDYLVRKEKI